MGRDYYWDIVKGLGIIAIVVGHTGSPLTPYVYMYHLVLFFFISGYLYKDKYSKNPFDYFSSRLQRLWWPMVQYGVAFSLLHNVFLRLNIYSEKVIPGILPAKNFNVMDFFYAIKGTIFMQTLEPMGGAMWFVHPLLISMTIFCLIRYVTIKISGFKREFIVGILVLGIYIFGLALAKDRIKLEYFTDVAMLVLPIIYAGFLIAKIWNHLPINWYFGILAFGAIVAIYKITGTKISLGDRIVIGPLWFLLVSFCGIYFNLVLAKTLESYKKIGGLVADLGKKSFHIMALHFLMFKIVSFFYVIVYDKPYFWIAKFPIIDSKWWLIYTIVGIYCSIICVDTCNFLKRKFISYYIKKSTN